MASSLRPCEAEICSVIASSGIFDPVWYLASNPDVGKSGLDPILHYVRHGEKENRQPALNFKIPCLQIQVESSGNRLYDYLIRDRSFSAQCGAAESVPIVFAANSGYIPYLSVAIASIIRHATANRDYRIHIFYQDVSSSDMSTLFSLASSNVEIKPICVKPFMKNIEARVHTSGHISTEAYFRFLIPRILSNYSKVLYLDCDIVVNKDISELYDYNIDSWLMGAIREPAIAPSSEKKIRQYLPDYITKYYNSGVLLINNSKFIERDMFGEFMKHVASGIPYFCHDQDILNIICHGEIRELDFTWNWVWQFYSKQMYKYADCETYAALAKSFSCPALVHFNSDKKPWRENDGHFAVMFWRYARYSPFFEKLRKECPYALEKILAYIEAEERAQ